MSELAPWKLGVEESLPIHEAVFKGIAHTTGYALAETDNDFAVMPRGTKFVMAEPCGISSWTKTVKVSTILSDGSPKRYFLKYVSGKGARALAEGEFHSAAVIDALVPRLVPKPVGWGEYRNGESQVYFLLADFHVMEFAAAPEPVHFMAQIAELHRKGTSPNGMFGFPVPTACGIMERTVTWGKSRAKSFTHQLNDVIRYDNETNGPRPEYDAACKQLIDVVTPRLLGAL